jgi:hypothetical protein
LCSATLEHEEWPSGSHHDLDFILTSGKTSLPRNSARDESSIDDVLGSGPFGRRTGFSAPASALAPRLEDFELRCIGRAFVIKDIRGHAATAFKVIGGPRLINLDPGRAIYGSKTLKPWLTS